VRAAIGSLAAKAGGIDALVFTVGIGEHSAQIRNTICAPLDFFGFALDIEANTQAAARIEANGSKPILIIPADEEGMIHRLCLALK
jgi:acetate kinase